MVFGCFLMSLLGVGDQTCGFSIFNFKVVLENDDARERAENQARQPDLGSQRQCPSWPLEAQSSKTCLIPIFLGKKT